MQFQFSKQEKGNVFFSFLENAEHVSDFFVGGNLEGREVSYWRAENVSELTTSMEIALSPSCLPVHQTFMITDVESVYFT